MEQLLIYSIYEVFWSKLLGLMDSVLNVYTAFFDLCAKIFTGRLTIILNEMYESFWNGYETAIDSVNVIWSRIMDRYGIGMD